MRKEYNFSNAIKNPYPNKLKKQITIRLDMEVVNYFKDLSANTGISYQNLINLYLVDCAERKLQPKIKFG